MFSNATAGLYMNMVSGICELRSQAHHGHLPESMRFARDRATSRRVRLTCGRGSGHVVGIDTCPGWQFKDMPPGPRGKDTGKRQGT